MWGNAPDSPMPTRQELIDQARADQRQRSLLARAANPKAAIVGIGKRYPQTGLHDVLLPDGSTQIGERQFNSGLPEGAQVLGIPKETGGWVLDERDVVANPIVPVAKAATGKIKYLYSVLNDDDTSDLWLGGFKPTPVKLKAIAVGESSFLLRNTGGNRYFLDYFSGNALRSSANGDILYTYSLSVESFGLAGHGKGYSFFARGSYGAVPANPIDSYWGKLWRAAFLGGIVFRGNASEGTQGPAVTYLLPNLLSPSPEIIPALGPVYSTLAINQSGSRGVGVRATPDDSATIASYSDPGGIVDTGVAADADSFLGSGCFDCFDGNFSAIDTATFSTDVFAKPKFTGSISIYGFNAKQKRSVQTTVFGIPAAQRSHATLIGRPSYHPRTITL